MELTFNQKLKMQNKYIITLKWGDTNEKNFITFYFNYIKPFKDKIDYVEDKVDAAKDWASDKWGDVKDFFKSAHAKGDGYFD